MAAITRAARTKTEVLVKAAANAADSKKAERILVMDMRKVFPITDYFVICSAPTTRQMRAISDTIEEKLAELGATPYLREGDVESCWLLLDYVDFVIHVFRDKERDYYQLERLWSDAPEVDWE